VRALRTWSLLLATAAAFAALVPGTASAQPVSAGTLDVVSEPGDFVGEGQTYHYDTTAGATFAATSDTFGAIRIEYHGPTGDSGTLAFIPPTNQLFTVGTTYTVDPSVLEPTMNVNINNRGCAFMSGWFTVEDIAYLPDGSLDRFTASFEQHCNGAVEALRGRIALDVAPPGPPLTVSQSLEATGTVVKSTGSATVAGTVTCSKPTFATIGASVDQVRKGVESDGIAPVTVSCGPTPTAWSATVTPSTGKFVVGTASLATTVQATDPDTAQLLVVRASRTITLVKP
jgi:hypothetical protein